MPPECQTDWIKIRPDIFWPWSGSKLSSKVIRRRQFVVDYENNASFKPFILETKNSITWIKSEDPVKMAHKGAFRVCTISCQP